MSRAGPRDPHGLGCRRRLVEQQCVAHGQAREITHHRLVVQQCLEPALSDFRLIRRVGRVPSRVFQDVALDHRWRKALVVAQANERPEDLIALGDASERRERFDFAAPRRKRQRPAQANTLGDPRIDDGIERVVAELARHRG